MGQQCDELRYKEVGALLGSDKEAYGYFGASVAVAGNRLVVGVPGKDSLAVNTGIVYVYDWNGTAYVEVGRITASDAATNNYFGLSVALSGDGDRLAVGAHVEDTASVDAGKVYIFDWNSTTSMYDDVSQLTVFDTRAGEWFGVNVALTGDGTMLVVGATCDATATDNAGKVYVYDWNSDTYVYDEVTTISASDGRANDWFGSSVDISSDSTRIVVGAQYESSAGADAGKVYVYDWNSDTYVYDEVVTITASDAQANDQFGVAVGISSDTLVVGAQYESSAGVDAGKVYVYNWNSNTSIYDEVSTITASDAQAYDYFGIALALSSDSTRLLVGALTRNASLTNAGKVYGYDLQSGNEEQ